MARNIIVIQDDSEMSDILTWEKFLCPEFSNSGSWRVIQVMFQKVIKAVLILRQNLKPFTDVK